MNQKEFADLLQRYRAGGCTNEEKALIEGWYNSRLEEPYHSLSEPEEALVGENIKNRIDQELESIHNHHQSVPLWRIRKAWWVAAASLIVLASATYLALRDETKTKEVAKTGSQSKPVVVPGGNKALLTLADGSVIVLDSAANGQLTTQGATMIVKRQDGQLVYDVSGNKSGSSSNTWNTIQTPRGGQYQVVLPDGTKVWLNAASSLRFPAVFATGERRVELNGEAYFEVTAMQAQAKKVPFVVEVMEATGSAARSRVEVLGTHFNIMAYADEASINTTLLEGKVKVVNRESAILSPGQQSRVDANGNMQLVPDADIEEAIAWKNGLFQFNNADVQTVMRQIARWYDVDIEYQGKIPTERFEGEIPRNSDINEVFKILELSNVHCKVEGKKITVLP